MNSEEARILIATILGNFIAGQINAIGTICPYFLSYFSSLNPSTSLSDVLSISTVAYILESTTFPMVSFLVLYLSDQTLMSGCLLLTTTLNILSVYFSNPWFFFISFGFSIGINATFMSYPIIWMGWKVYSKRKGLFAGISAAPYILAPFCLGAIFTWLVNPDNLEGEFRHNLVYFEETVYNRVPNALLWLAGINLVAGVVTIFMTVGLSSKPESKEESSLTLKGLLKQKTFWYLFFSLFFKIFFYHFLINVYKNLGMYYFNDDHFMNFASFLGFGWCAVGKIVLGALFDKFEWKKLSCVFITVEICLTLIGPFAWGNKALFCVWLSIALAVSGINFISIWVLTQNLYPKSNWVMSIVAVSLIFDMILVNFYMSYLVPRFGYTWVFLSLLSFHFISLILLVFKDKLTKDHKEDLLLAIR